MGNRPGGYWHEGLVRPCGTPAAYRRHLRHGETPCRACMQAETLRAAMWRERRRRRAAA